MPDFEALESQLRRWQCRHNHGVGRVHLVRPRVAMTACGTLLASFQGGAFVDAPANCQNCITRFRTDAIRNDEDRQWWADYDEYRRSTAWAVRREKVLRRAGYVCEACLAAPATEVHHASYAHLRGEPCFELHAICHDCHEAITRRDRERREKGRAA